MISSPGFRRRIETRKKPGEVPVRHQNLVRMNRDSVGFSIVPADGLPQLQDPEAVGVVGVAVGQGPLQRPSSRRRGASKSGSPTSRWITEMPLSLHALGLFKDIHHHKGRNVPGASDAYGRFRMFISPTSLAASTLHPALSDHLVQGIFDDPLGAVLQQLGDKIPHHTADPTTVSTDEPVALVQVGDRGGIQARQTGPRPSPDSPWARSS